MIMTELHPTKKGSIEAIGYENGTIAVRYPSKILMIHETTEAIYNRLITSEAKNDFILCNLIDNYPYSTLRKI